MVGRVMVKREDVIVAESNRQGGQQRWANVESVHHEVNGAHQGPSWGWAVSFVNNSFEGKPKIMPRTGVVFVEMANTSKARPNRKAELAQSLHIAHKNRSGSY